MNSCLSRRILYNEHAKVKKKIRIQSMAMHTQYDSFSFLYGEHRTEYHWNEKGLYLGSFKYCSKSL